MWLAEVCKTILNQVFNVFRSKGHEDHETSVWFFGSHPVFPLWITRCFYLSLLPNLPRLSVVSIGMSIGTALKTLTYSICFSSPTASGRSAETKRWAFQADHRLEQKPAMPQRYTVDIFDITLIGHSQPHWQASRWTWTGFLGSWYLHGISMGRYPRSFSQVAIQNPHGCLCAAHDRSSPEMRNIQRLFHNWPSFNSKKWSAADRMLV